MDTYIITYDLPDGSDYTALIDKIKEYGTWAHINYSTWAIVTDSSAVEIRDALKELIPSGGRIFVIKSGKVAAWRNAMCTNDWLHKNL